MSNVNSNDALGDSVGYFLLVLILAILAVAVSAMCGRAVYKWSLVTFNVIFVLIGLCLLILGLIAEFDSDIILKLFQNVPTDVVDPQEYDIPKLLGSATKIFITAGAFLFVVGFVGCCGALSSTKMCLLAYALILVVILGVQIAAGVLSGLFYKKVETHLQQFLKDSLVHNYIDGITFPNGSLKQGDDALSFTWDAVQAELECCGALDYTDYQHAAEWEKSYDINGTTVTAKVPPSCCKVKNPDKFPHEFDFLNLKECLQKPKSETTNLQGCYEATSVLIMEYSKIVIALVVIICLIEVLGILFSCLLYKEIKKNFQPL